MWNQENRKCECENRDQQRYIKMHENNFNKNKTIFEQYKHLVSTAWQVLNKCYLATKV